MNKRIFSVLTALALALNLTACGKDDNKNSAPANTPAGSTSSSAANTSSAGNNTPASKPAADSTTSQGAESSGSAADYKIIANVCGTELTELPVTVSFFESSGWKLTQDGGNYTAQKGDSTICLTCSEGTDTVYYIELVNSSDEVFETTLNMSEITLLDGCSLTDDGVEEMKALLKKRGIKFSYTEDMGGGYRLEFTDEDKNLKAEFCKYNETEFYLSLTTVSEKPAAPETPKPVRIEDRYYVYTDDNGMDFGILIEIYDTGGVYVTLSYYPNTYASFDSVEAMTTPTMIMSYSDNGQGGTGVADLGEISFVMTEETLIPDGAPGIGGDGDIVFKRVR